MCSRRAEYDNAISSSRRLKCIEMLRPSRDSIPVILREKLRASRSTRVSQTFPREIHQTFAMRAGLTMRARARERAERNDSANKIFGRSGVSRVSSQIALRHRAVYVFPELARTRYKVQVKFHIPHITDGLVGGKTSNRLFVRRAALTRAELIR